MPDPALTIGQPRKGGWKYRGKGYAWAGGRGQGGREGESVLTMGQARLSGSPPREGHTGCTLGEWCLCTLG